MIGFLKPAAHRQPIADEDVDGQYARLRLQVFLGIFVGYAGYYLVRKNFTLAMPFLIEEGYSKTELGFALSGVAIAYGLSKFVMGSVSDRSDARNLHVSRASRQCAGDDLYGSHHWPTASGFEFGRHYVCTADC